MRNLLALLLLLLASACGGNEPNLDACTDAVRYCDPVTGDVTYQCEGETVTESTCAEQNGTTVWVCSACRGPQASHPIGSGTKGGNDGDR